jgi:hypothetical protein
LVARQQRTRRTKKIIIMTSFFLIFVILSGERVSLSRGRGGLEDGEWDWEVRVGGGGEVGCGDWC